MQKLSEYLPNGALFYIEEWISGHQLEIKLTKNRNSKLGDYRKMHGKGHKITINSTLVPDLFFLVFTHELAHLLAFERFGRHIAPHGKEWKTLFGKMILESLSIYNEELKPILIKFSKSPKANFMASTDLVKYFRPETLLEGAVFVDNLNIGDEFLYKNQKFKILEKRRKNYLCVQMLNQKKYIFQSVTSVLPVT